VNTDENLEQLLSVCDSPAVTSFNPDFPDSTSTVTLRTLVSMKDAGLIIGKGGRNISSIREKSCAKIKISDVVRNVPCERIITITGALDNCAKVRRRILYNLGLQINICISY
jgi:predicted RNA-binding protein YlqC (UPF0109 family)